MWAIPKRIEVKTVLAPRPRWLKGEEPAKPRPMVLLRLVPGSWATIHTWQGQEVLSVFRGSQEPAWVRRDGHSVAESCPPVHVRTQELCDHPGAKWKTRPLYSHFALGRGIKGWEGEGCSKVRVSKLHSMKTFF